MKRAKKRVGLRGYGRPEFFIFLHSQWAEELLRPTELEPDQEGLIKLHDGYLVMIPGIRFVPRVGTPGRVEWQAEENRRARAMLDLASRVKAPWPDFRGADIFEGDTISITYRVGKARPFVNPHEVGNG